MHVPQTEVILRHEGTELARVTLPPGEYVIGRNPDADIRVDTPLLSRRHARLTINYDHLLIEDLGSSNGTFVTDLPVTDATRLFPNQAVRLGDVTLELHRQRAAPAPDVSLAPAQAAIRRFVPDEVLAEKRYAIGQQVARGGMGAILDAQQSAMKRRVAMKVMLDGADAADIARFVEEAQITGQLEHPNIVPIHELGVDEQDQLFYTMKFVRGITLKKVLELIAEGVEATERKYPLPALLTIFQKVCDALAFAHSKGVIHRDLKPENVMLDDFGVVLVMDWGLAKVVGASRSRAAVTGGTVERHSTVHSARAAEPELGGTLAGTILGTPQYMSPEQARGEVETLDTHSDIYTLGAILYHLLALRPPVTGEDAWAIVEKVARGETEPLIAKVPPRSGGFPTADDPPRAGGAHPAGEVAGSARDGHGRRLENRRSLRIPDSLTAVVRKAMAFDRTARYATVAELQRDLEAYQTGFATSAENAGWFKRTSLAIKRNKAAAIGAAAVLLVGSVLGTKAIIEGRRAEREATVAKTALANLKASAPALLKLAESEADTQDFAAALRDMDAALALDPALDRARWQRAWVLLGLERWSEAAAALRLARQHDPSAANLASILPAVENLAAATDAELWKSDAAREVFHHLQSAEATGAALVFANKLKLITQERRKFVEQRLAASLGKGNFIIAMKGSDFLSISAGNKPLHSLEVFRGLPIDRLIVNRTPITDLEPLRGIRLREVWLDETNISDLAPLRGMPLTFVNLSVTKVIDLTPLAGARLTQLNINNTDVTSLAPLRGMPLVDLDIGRTKIFDISPLKGAPLESLRVSITNVSDFSVLRGMPLRVLQLSATPTKSIADLRGLPLEELKLDSTSIEDLSPLHGAPLKDLNIRSCKQLTDYTPVLTLARLERLSCDVLPAELLPLRESATLQSIDADAYPGEAHTGPRPAAEFWPAYDAWKAKQEQ